MEVGAHGTEPAKRMANCKDNEDIPRRKRVSKSGLGGNGK